MGMGIDASKIRKDFPILKSSRNGKRIVYLDNASTSQKPKQVIHAIDDYYKNYNANIHRGLYDMSVKATESYVRSKELASKLIGSGSYANIIYCRNTTEAINIVALSWGEQNLKQSDRILITGMEHHSNIVPWQLLAKRKGAFLDYIKLKKGSLQIDMDDYKKKLEKSPKIVAFTHVSNVLGTINYAKEMAKQAHSAGAKVLLDGAQSVPHFPVNVKELDCDFLAFSSHKMLGPAGIGVLYAKRELLEQMPPALGGGDMIRTVDFQGSTWNDLPWKFEAGTSNVEGAIGFGAAVEYLNSVGMNKIKRHEQELAKYALKRLEEIKAIKIYGIGSKEMSENNRLGVVSFNIKGAHAHDVSAIFNSENIAIRAGHHCAMPLVTQIIGEPAVARMSFYLYNEKEDIDKAIEAIEKVRRVLKIS